MKKLSKNDYELLNTLMSLKETGVHAYMSNFLLNYYDNLLVTSDYIIAEGDIPVVLVAHMDTVEERSKQYMLLYDSYKNIATSLYSVGFDDKAGIAAIIKLLQKGLRPCIILSTGEESGCVGSSKLVADYPEPPFTQKIKYMIQIDRRGTNDCVFYENDNDEFINYIESFGYYKLAYGSFTDISVLAPTWNISAVNLSTGYFNEHTQDEYLYVPAWYETIRQIEIILKSVDTAPYFDYVPMIYTTSWWRNPILNEEVYPFYQEKCDKCKKEYDYSLLDEVVNIDGDLELWCEDCVKNYSNICSNCYEIYELTSEYNMKCPTCGKNGKRIDYDRIRNRASGTGK